MSIGQALRCIGIGMMGVAFVMVATVPGSWLVTSEAMCLPALCFVGSLVFMIGDLEPKEKKS